MKFKYIVGGFIGLTILSVLTRALQIISMTDEKGFTLPGQKTYSLLATAVIFGLALCLAVIGLLTHRCPAHPPKINLVLAFPSIVLGLWIFFDIIHSFFSSKVPLWQIALLSVFGVLSGIVFILYGLKAFKNINLPSIVFVIPVIYQIVRLLCVFISISSLAFTTGHILMLVSDCAVLLFFLELGKMMCGLDKEKNYRKLLSAGMLAGYFCMVNTVPYIIILLTGKQVVLNESYSSLILTFLIGIFCIIFLANHFSLNNRQIFKKQKKKQSKDGNEKSDSGTAFYTP
ncbi:MAG: hypothetical protein IKI29_07445 [Clostridia bacterium]|nr:hypothetical protein [Clostridia bacterium]